MDSAHCVRWRFDILAGLDIPTPVKVFLCEVGLPNVTSLPLVFITDGRRFEDMMVLADSYGSKTLLKLGVGTIFMEQHPSPYDPGTVYRLTFVNSSVQQFHDFLCLYEAFATDPRIQSEEVEYIRAKIEDLEKGMMSIDSGATEPGTAWGQILEETRWPI